MMNKIHNMPQPVGVYQEQQNTYFDGNSRTIYTTDIETEFPDGCLITSRTDTNGVITHANESFVKLSGWTRDEIIGQPHGILRHPDMPKAAFADMWDTLKRGEKWHGYVKNLRKDGGFYWVYATVIPNIRNGQTVGYTSVRRKPCRDKIEAAKAQYAQMLAEEHA
ncbi:PAS domain-containing protein [Wielerella bovis]|uniref:PAS domain-containing protein n=1 Tax=Wielerella bovis TaxID=2917790 RepID=UPI002019435D|nr:PAS domain-containing protein [Wielerella bovis]MCG7656255.1 PAS domain-containing protein [Wielerella bovis]MCG7658480.1 PAS domain-containing protein [Wielerella bovis]ULJ60573.1 PAS domain-containing protein [Wielerella bovis]ULJ65013.1 PAS domain-containing protein [Wielerella bovis]ULJ67286.1 PAS domain-containing protein [Wielerella bovis]